MKCTPFLPLLLFLFYLTPATGQNATGQDQDSARCGCLARSSRVAGILSDTLNAKMVDTLNNKRIALRLDLIRSFNDVATTYLGWCLLIVGGTILTIISTGYRFPLKDKIRWIYLLFLPGWLFTAFTINNCLNITESYLGAKAYGLADCIQMCTMKDVTQHLYDKMVLNFRISMLIFGAWLLAMLFVWVFCGAEQFETKK